ncbi:helix-turn-helix domain-containing protein [Alicyclobacillus macrosporangiidus]|uniref:helix-turn-helix domain-containing protein n=1 Tax=Alicyclobacillus macrosporangiidus TaxID=392015 RepID=UPI000AA0460F|nr:helix-turn-helix domain-containing protein [Alicyclobacillus macrosporangiidus]
MSLEPLDFVNFFTFVYLLMTLGKILSKKKKNWSLYMQKWLIPMSIDYQKGVEPAMNMRIRLREARERAGLTQSELARLSGVSQSHISEIETNRTAPTVFVAKKLARVLGVSVDDLIEEEPNEMTELLREVEEKFKEKWIQQGKREVAERMFSQGASVADVVELTGLSEEEAEEMKRVNQR